MITSNAALSVSKADILIVDDSPDNLRVLSATLIQRGYDVRCVKSGSMALIGIQSIPPDLILLDIRMPVMNGYETCQRIKTNPITSEIPIIFLSALDEAIDKVRAFEVGGADYITKPFQVEEVLARVEHQLTIQRLQKQLVQQNQRLQQEIKQHQQTEAALRDAKEAAEAANFAKSEFLARVSHELRTPLNVILGFTHLMQTDELLPANYQDYVATIHDSGQHLLKSINNILTVTQAENSQLSLNETIFDLHELLNHLATIWQPKAEAKGLTFAIERAPDIPRHINADANKLYQILVNLLENAINYTTEGSIKLRLRMVTAHMITSDRDEATSVNTANKQPETSLAKTVTGQMRMIQFELQDTGAGIVASETSRLFEPFAHAKMVYKAEQGIGLGLPICRQFVQRMGGEIAIRSKPGQGTLISFYIQARLVGTDAITECPQSQQPVSSTSGLPRSFHASLNFEELTPEILQGAMPVEWINRLHQAAVKGFDVQILQLIREIPPEQVALTKTLENWTSNFRFDRITALTQPVIDLPRSPN